MADSGVARRWLVTRLPLALVAATSGAEAQPRGKIATLGFLIYTTPSDATWDVLRNALRERGWIEGQNLAIESRWADGQVARLPAADLVARKVDVIVISGAAVVARAAQRATRTIPIVFVGLPISVATELSGNIARPKGNLTGVAYHATPEQAAKELEIYHELSGKPSRVVVLREETELPHSSAYRPFVRAAADKLGVTFETVEFAGRDSIEAALGRVAAMHPGALWITFTAITYAERHRIAEFATANRLPSFAACRAYAEAGGLASYAANSSELQRRGADHVDRLLREQGLPIYQSSNRRSSSSSST